MRNKLTSSPSKTLAPAGPLKPNIRPLRPRKKVGPSVKSTQASTSTPVPKVSKRKEIIPGKLKRTESALSAAKKQQRLRKFKAKADEERKAVGERPYSFVYVGDLEPTITEEQLRIRFSACGPIVKIVIRCSRGQVIRVLPREPGSKVPFGPRDKKYASIEFRDSKAYLRALKLNGQLLHGTRMVVCTSAADLPEAQESGGNRTASIVASQVPQSQRNMVAKNSSQQKPAVIPRGKEPQNITGRASTAMKPDGDRFRLLGMSFAKCVI